MCRSTMTSEISMVKRTHSIRELLHIAIIILFALQHSSVYELPNFGQPRRHVYYNGYFYKSGEKVRGYRILLLKMWTGCLLYYKRPVYKPSYWIFATFLHFYTSNLTSGNQSIGAPGQLCTMRRDICSKMIILQIGFICSTSQFLKSRWQNSCS